MEVWREYRRQRIRAARDRCLALTEHLKRFDKQVQVCPVTHLVVNAYRHALQRLDTKLEVLDLNQTQPIYSETFLQDRIDFCTGYIRWISQLIGMIENADVVSVPAELALTLRRQIKKHFPNAELIIVTAPDLNYSILDISKQIEALFSALECNLPDRFPDQVFRITIPAVEHDQALLHCMLAHEMGHPLYDANELLGSIQPINIDDSHLDRVYKAYRKEQDNAKTSSQTEIPFTEIQFKAKVSRYINEVITHWIGEIAADLYGLLILGPAYVIAFFSFSSASQRMDLATHTHPPPRIRCQNLLASLTRGSRNKYDLADLREHTRATIRMLEQVSAAPIEGMHVVHQVAAKSIQKEEILQRIRSCVQDSLNSNLVYGRDQYVAEIDDLVSLINHMIVPVETLQNGEHKAATFPGILNAGWECFLGGLTEYAKLLPENAKGSPFSIALHFNRFLMKAMELNEVKLAWEEERIASIGE